MDEQPLNATETCETLGHQTVTTTLNHYADVIPSTQADVEQTTRELPHE